MFIIGLIMQFIVHVCVIYWSHFIMYVKNLYQSIICFAFTLLQVNCSPESVITTFDVASSSQALVFGDNLGSLHLFSTGNKPTFNNFSQVRIL